MTFTKAEIIQVCLVRIEKIEIILSYKLYKFFFNFAFSELFEIH